VLNWGDRLHDIGYQTDGNDLSALAWSYYNTEERPTNMGLHNALILAQIAIENHNYEAASPLLARVASYQTELAESDSVRLAYFSLRLARFHSALEEVGAYQKQLKSRCSAPKSQQAHLVCQEFGSEVPLS
jgi:hypothetical protein